MARKKSDVRSILEGTEPYFYMMKGDGYEKLRLLEVREDSIVIELPKGAPMRKTMIGIVTFEDGSGVLEVDGRVEAEENATAGSIRLCVDPEHVRKLERRAFPRVSFAPPIDAEIQVEGSCDRIPARIVNLSAGGLRAESEKELPPERLSTFHFEIEIDDEIHEMALDGRIVYEIPIDGGHAYGVKLGRGKEDETLPDDDSFVDPAERMVDLMNLVNRLIVRQ